jgi:hypothetical protein
MIQFDTDRYEAAKRMALAGIYVSHVPRWCSALVYPDGVPRLARLCRFLASVFCVTDVLIV